MATEGGASPGGFLSQQPQTDRPSWLPWIIAGLVVLLVLGGVLVSGHHTRSVQQAQDSAQTADPYAAQLSIDHLEMSEATNFAGGKLTYVDGEIANKGTKTVSGVNVLVTFNNAIGDPPQRLPMPLSLIRTRDPYVDIEPVSADPLKPGAKREFRLIFDHITPSWNQQYPSIEPTHIQAN